MSKARETWEIVKKYLNIYHHQAVSEKVDVETVEGRPLEDIDKALKALEIIKEKTVNSEYIKCCENYEQYKTVCSYWNAINQEEYELLKEILS